MKKRDRTILKTFYINNKENIKIKKKMSEVGKENFSDFTREMLLDGKVKVIDFELLKQIRYELNRIGNNINQTVRLANENRNIDEEKINEIIKLQDELLKTVIEITQNSFEKIQNRR